MYVYENMYCIFVQNWEHTVCLWHVCVGAEVIVLDAAVLIEAGWDSFVHEVWTTLVPRDEVAWRCGFSCISHSFEILIFTIGSLKRCLVATVTTVGMNTYEPKLERCTQYVNFKLFGNEHCDEVSLTYMYMYHYITHRHTTCSIYWSQLSKSVVYLFFVLYCMSICNTGC